MIITLMIRVYEEIKFLTFDLLGAFLQVKLSSNKLLLLILRVQFVDIMYEINPEHKKNFEY